MIEAHPLAAVFPMMTDDELQDLADDIREHGLLHPIVVDQHGRLVDGRNRERACVIAGVVPRIEQLNGRDAASFIVSANLNRRNLTIGQQAIALAMIYPEPAKLKRAGSSVAEQQTVSKERLSVARYVLRHSQALADDVMAKHLTLDAAFEKVKEARQASQTTDAKMAELRANASDLADLVDEERLPLSEAYAAHQKRMADAAAAEANKRETMLRLSEAAWHGITAWASYDFVAEVTERLCDPEFSKQWLARVRPEPTRINDIMAGAEKFALVVKDQSNV